MFYISRSSKSVKTEHDKTSRIHLKTNNHWKDKEHCKTNTICYFSYGLFSYTLNMFKPFIFLWSCGLCAEWFSHLKCCRAVLVGDWVLFKSYSLKKKKSNRWVCWNLNKRTGQLNVPVPKQAASAITIITDSKGTENTLLQEKTQYRYIFHSRTPHEWNTIFCKVQ